MRSLGRPPIRVAVLGLAVLVASGALADDAARDARVQPLLDAARGEQIALLLGRRLARDRFDELVDLARAALAPRGRWDAHHAAWEPARAALTAVLRRRTAASMRGETGRWVHAVVRDRSLEKLTDDERAQATAFYGSPGGRVWIDRRARFLEASTYGLLFVDEPEPRATYERASSVAEKALLGLPEADMDAVYEFTNSPLGEKLTAVQNEEIARPVANVLRASLETILRDEWKDIVDEVRARVPALPPTSEKTYLGTVTMRADRTLDVVVEQHDGFRMLGTYAFSYAPDALHFADVAAGVPDIAPGETRLLYRDPAGRLSDRP